ncbi:MAG: PAS domain S-box protein, partial [Candidatus Latescibacterota bacterium]
MSSAQPSPDYRAVFESLPLPATLIDPAGVIVDLNEASLQVAHRVGRRVTKADRIGHDFAAFAIQPEDGARATGMVERALREGAADEPLWEFRDAAGTPFWMEFHAAAVQDAAKRCTGVVVLRHDVTERVRHERLRDCQERLHEALWHLTGTNALGELLEILHRELVTLCPQTANSSVQMRPVNGQPWTSYHLSADGVQLAQSRLESNRAVAACWEEQRPIYRPDLTAADQYGETAEIWDPETGYGDQVRSVLDVPFAHGTLAVNSRSPHAYAEDEIRAIWNLAQVLSLGLARIEDQQRLAERNRQLEEEVAERRLAQEALARRTALLSAAERISGTGAWVWDVVRQEAFWSDQAYRIHDLEPGALTHGSAEHVSLSLQCYDEADRPRVMAAFQRCADLGESYDLEVPFTTTQGRRRWIRTLGMAEREDSRVVRVVGALQDITDHRRAQEALRASEERFRRLVETPEGIGVVYADAGGSYQYMSPQMKALTGYGVEELNADPALRDRLIHPDDLPRYLDARLQVMAGGPEQRLSFRWRHRDGEWRWGSGTLSPLRDPSGALVALQAVLQDVTVQREAEYRLRLDLSLQRLRVAVSLMRGEEDWTTVVQTAHRELAAWVPVNAVTINVLDPEAGTLAVIGVGPDLVAHAAPRGRPRPEVMAALGTVFRTGEPLYRPSRRDPLFPLDMPDAVNSVVDVAFLGGTIGVNHTREDAYTDRDVEVIAEFAGVISEGYRRLQDLTALRESEERFRQAQKMEAVGLLAGGVAHDFNNLLTVVIGQAQLGLQRADQSPEMRELLEEIERAGRRGAGLVQQLLAFSRRQTRRPERLDLNAAVAESAKMLRQLLGDEIELVALLDREPVGVEMDRGQLTQLILNLAVNARDAMPEGVRLT